MSEPLDRRTLLRRLGSVAVLLNLNPLRAGALIPGRPSAPGAALAAAWPVSAAAAARRVGVAYLEEYPQERDPYVLLARLPVSAAELEGLSSVALLARLQQAHRDDFVAGRVRSVDGWQLSATEARLCAVLALKYAEQDRLALR